MQASPRMFIRKIFPSAVCLCADVYACVFAHAVIEILRRENLILFKFSADLTT